MAALVVMPTYNEAENIDRVLRAVRLSLPDAGILVVDDGSPDGTADLAEKLGVELGHIDVLRRSAKSGLGSAYRAGFAWGLQRGWAAFVEMDADLQHDPQALPSLVAPIGTGLGCGHRAPTRWRSIDRDGWRSRPICAHSPAWTAKCWSTGPSTGSSCGTRPRGRSVSSPRRAGS